MVPPSVGITSPHPGSPHGWLPPVWPQLVFLPEHWRMCNSLSPPSSCCSVPRADPTTATQAALRIGSLSVPREAPLSWPSEGKPCLIHNLPLFPPSSLLPFSSTERTYILPSSKILRHPSLKPRNKVYLKRNHDHILEKETATHSNIHAWKIPWTEEPGGLQSMGSQRVRHD